MPQISSLKGYTPALARILGTSASALYERQRELVRAGLLDLGDGRGPGSGVRTTASSVALLVLAVLASDKIAGLGDRAAAIAEAKPFTAKRGKGGKRRCPCTGEANFLDALAYLFLTNGAVTGLKEVFVSRTSDCAGIRYRSKEYILTSIFKGWNISEPSLTVVATIDAIALGKIAADVQAIAAEESDSP